MGSNPNAIALDIKPPAPPEGPLDMYARVLGIKNMQLQQQGQQQALETGRLQQQQLTETMQDDHAWRSVMSNPDWDGTPEDLLKRGLKAGVGPKSYMGMQQGMVEMKKNLAGLQKDELANATTLGDQHRGQIMSVVNGPENQKQTQWSQIIAKEEQDGTIPKGTWSNVYPGDEQATALANHLALGSTLAKETIEDKAASARQQQAATGASEAPSIIARNTAETNKANMEVSLKGDPMKAMETDPSQMAGDKLPAAMGYLQSKITDPGTSPEDKARATRLLSTAKTTQGVQLAMEASKKATDQAIADGDPNAAADLLTSGTVAPSQLISSRKPEFAQKAFTIASQKQPGWNAQKAEAEFKVASSPAQVQFFGSAKSLTDKGGTLDQLADAAKDIPQGQIPVFNSIADATKASLGSGPIAKYASILLGVSDDYSKVMGGGQGSDASRTQALKLVPANASPEARAAAIEGIRGAVGSQINSRVGNNTVLQRMYGGDLPSQTAPKPAAKTLSMSQIQKAAQDHGVSVEEATRQAKAAGYAVQ